MADVFGGVVEGIAQIPGTAFLHVRITVFKLPGLVEGWISYENGIYCPTKATVTSTSPA